VEFKEKAMPWLMSLRLICTEPAEDLAVTGIAHLPHLNEIILHPGALQAKIRAWEDAAAKHKNRPYVKKQPDETHQKKKQPDGV
jgi:disease resistance protein RPM1